MNLTKYTKEESRLHEVAEEWAIYSAAIDREIFAAKRILGQGNSVFKFIGWAKEQAEKYKPWLDALIQLMAEVRPILFPNGQFVKPKKYSLSTFRIGWAAFKFLMKVIF